jgi:PIN domain nuclease of toxin-antitoxin system
VISLDTHVLVFALTGQVDARERSLLANHTWGISAIVLWELAKLTRLGRIRMDLEDAEVVRTLSVLKLWPIDLAVSLQSTRLDFKSDPADELIAATSIVHKVPLLTRDQRILGSRIVPLA